MGIKERKNGLTEFEGIIDSVEFSSCGFVGQNTHIKLDVMRGEVWVPCILPLKALDFVWILVDRDGLVHELQRFGHRTPNSRDRFLYFTYKNTQSVR